MLYRICFRLCFGSCDGWGSQTRDGSFVWEVTRTADFAAVAGTEYTNSNLACTHTSAFWVWNSSLYIVVCVKRRTGHCDSTRTSTSTARRTSPQTDRSSCASTPTFLRSPIPQVQRVPFIPKNPKESFATNPHHSPEHHATTMRSWT